MITGPDRARTELAASYPVGMPAARVLIVGLDPGAWPGADVQAIERGLAWGRERVQAARIAFNADGGTSLEAVRRVLP
jgi:hypothetical protein